MAFLTVPNSTMTSTVLVPSDLVLRYNARRVPPLPPDYLAALPRWPLEMWKAYFQLTILFVLKSKEYVFSPSTASSDHAYLYVELVLPAKLLIIIIAIMSKVNTLYSYFQKTPTREKSPDSVAGLCKVDDNANIQSSSDVKRPVTSKCSKHQRSPVKLFRALSKKSTGSRDQPADVGMLAMNGSLSFGRQSRLVLPEISVVLINAR